MALARASRVPVATYRLQLRKDFPFDAARDIVGLAHQLGISDLYCSPILLSTPGSTHGYDVNDYRRIDPELGGRGALEKLHAELARRDMGLLLDFVPNHMGINGPGLLNTWWRDVLENGERSRHARFFDIDWESEGPGGASQVLVPILEDHYGRVLEAGKLTLVRDGGTFAIAYSDMRFPVSPRTYAKILDQTDSPVAQKLAQEFGALRSVGEKERERRLAELKQQLGSLLDSDAGVSGQVERRVAELNGKADTPGSFDALDAIIAMQHYRLAYWKAGAQGTNYRRFFAIDSLIGLRMEESEVFRECHALVARLLHEKTVTGLRIDHVDGLRDPRQYLGRLQALAQVEIGQELFVVVEKILAEDEGLPPDWSVHGTTGYEFIAQLAAVLVDPVAARRFTRLYEEFCGESAAFDEVVYEKKRLILDDMFANAVAQLAAQFGEIMRTDRRWRDLTRHELMVAVREIMAAHGVYRTYRRTGGAMDERDRRVVEQATAIAVARNRRIGAEPFELVRDALTGAYPLEGAPAGLRERLEGWTLSFQQYTGAVMAKAVEDTAFYTYNRFVGLNEVGGNPGHFGGAVAAFHAANAERFRRSPHSLLTTATHDTKLGEDARARLYALSELPHEWREWVLEWRELNQQHKTIVDGRAAPDANEEYRLYQILLGVWPADDADPDDALRQRLREYFRKAVNEAKRNTTWVQPNDKWIEAGDRFIDGILNVDTGRAFLASFRPKAQRLAHLGMVNSLTQVVLKITSPGVPDFYQGCELWDLSLVDPDNRRPVDFARRHEIAKSLPAVSPAQLLRDWRSGAIKLWLMHRLLGFRREQPALFGEGDYQPLGATGRFAESVIAFARTHGEQTAVVVVPRFTSKLGCPPLGLAWEDTAVTMPAGATKGWRETLTGRRWEGQASLRLAELFAELSVAVLERA